MAKVSVLVAVYNASQYLAECLDSLLAQTLTDIEIICVDDCSTDNSPDLLQSYADRDHRIVVIRQEKNTGQGHARNHGLQYATGQYVAFLDSDDWMSPDCLQRAATVLDYYADTGCVLLRVKNCPGDDATPTDYPMQPFEVMSGRQAFELSIDWQVHGWYVARRELYERFPYDETCHSYSDDNTTRVHYYHSKEVRCCDGIYYYRINNSSVTHKPSVHRFDYMRANESMKRQLVDMHVDERILCRYETVRMLVLVESYGLYHCFHRELDTTATDYAMSEMRRVWASIERQRLLSPKTHKFGYRPMPTWWLFRCQEWLYFTLRGWLGKNRW